MTETLVALTKNAIKKVREIAVEEDSAAIIRAGVKGGGCAGYSYVLTFEVEDDIQDTDNVIQCEDVRVVVDMMSSTYLEGTTIDYVDGLMGAGFKFNNKSAKKTCGCGSSFTI